MRDGMQHIRCKEDIQNPEYYTPVKDTHGQRWEKDCQAGLDKSNTSFATEMGSQNLLVDAGERPVTS